MKIELCNHPVNHVKIEEQSIFHAEKNQKYRGQVNKRNNEKTNSLGKFNHSLLIIPISFLLAGF